MLMNLMDDSNKVIEFSFFSFNIKHEKVVVVVYELLLLFDKGEEGEAVAVEAEAGDDAFADGG